MGFVILSENKTPKETNEGINANQGNEVTNHCGSKQDSAGTNHNSTKLHVTPDNRGKTYDH